jgi:hypothetical protein
VRNQALQLIGRNFKNDDDLTNFYKYAVNDSSYMVMQSALDLLATNDKDAAMQIARKSEGYADQNIMVIIAKLYSANGTDKQASYMLKSFQSAKGNNKYRMIQSYGRFLTRCTEKDHITEGLQALYAEGLKNTEWHDRLSITQSLKTLTTFLQDKENTLKKSGDTAGEKEAGDLHTAAEKYMNDLKKNEKDEELIKIYQSGK